MTSVARQSATKTAKKTLPDLPVVDDKTIDFETIESLFFAYRDFVSDPDAILAKLGYGRAHHRVVHFVSRRPGMTVADLLGILQITKQSLARVLKELIDSGLERSMFLYQAQSTNCGFLSSLCRCVHHCPKVDSGGMSSSLSVPSNEGPVFAMLCRALAKTSARSLSPLAAGVS